jgi:hypothetical protein
MWDHHEYGSAMLNTEERESSSCNPVLLPFLGSDLQLRSGELDRLLDLGEVVERKYEGQPSIIRIEAPLPVIIKLWHPRSKFSSTWLFPYSHRFRKNADLLRRRSVVAPKVLGWGITKPDRVRFVAYEEIPGVTVREVIDEVDLKDFATYLLALHEAGIDFRSGHAGNILRCPDNSFALIDVTDCSFHKKPVRMNRRLKCLVRLFSHRRDLWYFGDQNRASLIEAYYGAMDVSPGAVKKAVAYVRKHAREPSQLKH